MLNLQNEHHMENFFLKALRLTFVSFLIWGFHLSVVAQTPADSLVTPLPGAKVDSLSKKITAKPLLEQWKLHSPLTTPLRDSLLKSSFRFDDLLLANYTGLADIFRYNPEVQTFDFMEMGLPRFIAELHLWPQQTRFYLDDFLANDPTTGLFNTRLIFPDALQRVVLFDQTQKGQFTGMPRPMGNIALDSRFVLKDEPYTRIMYREGDFGYTDLDITFARFVNSKTAIQLGGINRDYSLNGYRATHYRGLVTHEITPRLIGQFFYRKSSENVSFRDVYGTEFGTFRTNDVWEIFRAQLWHLNDRQKPDWQIRMLFNDDRRESRFNDLNQLNKIRFDRFTLQGIYQKSLKFGTLNTLIEAGQNKIWGNVYYRKYTDSYLTFKSATEFPLADSLSVNAALALNYQWGQPLRLNPAVYFKWQSASINLNLNATQFTRFPSTHERFFSRYGIQGNRSLDPEIHREVRSTVLWKMFPCFHSKFSLVYHRVSDEILFTGKTFINNSARNFTFAEMQSALKWFKFGVQAGGQTGLTGTLSGPESSVYARLTYHDRWLKGHLIIDASGNIQWFDTRKNVAYNPLVERFYRVSGTIDGFFLLSYKIVATVKDAHLFMEMDNPFGQQYHVIRGYPELYRRLRFGVSWVLWN